MQRRARREHSPTSAPSPGSPGEVKGSGSDGSGDGAALKAAAPCAVQLAAACPRFSPQGDTAGGPHGTDGYRSCGGDERLLGGTLAGEKEKTAGSVLWLFMAKLLTEQDERLRRFFFNHKSK